MIRVFCDPTGSRTASITIAHFAFAPPNQRYLGVVWVTEVVWSLAVADTFATRLMLSKKNDPK